MRCRWATPTVLASASATAIRVPLVDVVMSVMFSLSFAKPRELVGLAAAAVPLLPPPLGQAHGQATANVSERQAFHLVVVVETPSYEELEGKDAAMQRGVRRLL